MLLYVCVGGGGVAGAMRQRKLGSHTPPCHRRMVITTLFGVFLAALQRRLEEESLQHNEERKEAVDGVKQEAAVLGGGVVVPSIFLNNGKTEALADVGSGGDDSCSEDQLAPSAEEDRGDPSATAEVVGVVDDAEDGAIVVGGDVHVLSVPVTQQGDYGLKMALLSLLSAFSRVSNVHLLNLQEGSPREVAVRRFFLNSITGHRSHWVAPKKKQHTTSVQWLQNPYLRKAYDAKRQTIEGSNRGGCGALPKDFTRRAAIKLQCEDIVVPNLNEVQEKQGGWDL